MWERKFNADRETNVALFGEEGEQLKQVCITVTDNILPSKMIL